VTTSAGQSKSVGEAQPLDAVPAPAMLPESSASRRAHWLARIASFSLSGYGFLGYLFLYLPILILVFFSFNASRSTAQWAGFSTEWYVEMINDDQIILSLWNSLFLAVVSTAIATVLGTLAAMAMERYFFTGKLMMDALLYLPIIIPDIAMAIMLLIFFNISGIGFEPWKVHFFGVELAVPYSVIIGHVAFNISFVAVVVRARLSQMDRTLEEAAHDLYADNWQTFRRVTLPMLMPGIIGGALLAFTLSLDDFVITFFTSGAGFNTLPVRVFAMIKKVVTPKINAVSTVMLAASLLLVIISLFMRRGGEETSIDIGI
jgi:spermidine/putrescine transport system permease protein